ncbi:MAG: ATP-binding protein [Coriobacteriia bacterium]|nr:ATP-binding protein [Coriobacteriia bacterium]
MTRPPEERTSRYRIRLVASFIAVMALFAGAWTWSLYGPLTRAIVDQQEEYLVGIGRAAALAVARTDEPLEDEVERLAEGTELRFTIVDPTGVVLADSDEDARALENHADRPEIRSALGGRVGADVRRSDTQGVDRMYVAVPLATDGERIAVRVSTSLAHIDDVAGRTRRTGLLLLGFALTVAIIAVWRLSYAAAGPVERLAAAAHAMAEGDLSSPIPVEGDSLAPLSSALARLAGQMRDRISALEAEEHTLRLVLDNLSDAVVLLEDERVALSNRALTSMFRMPPTRTRGKTIDSLGLPAPVESAIVARLGSEEPASAEIGPDPYRRSHRLLAVPLGTTDGLRRTLVVIADVTDRMRLDAMRRDFVANASHELKTPTAGILLLAGSADDAARDGDSAQALAFLSQIQAEAARLKRLVGDLLDLSRLETLPAADAVTDVRRAVELATAGHRRAAAAKGLRLETDFSGVTGQDVAVHAESTDIAVALDNLLSNAIAYTEHGSVTVGVRADDGQAQISVADTGIGIPPADVERVFERFYRVDRARSRTSGGTGLGLSLVRNVAERSGGTVTIESEPGAGTIVTLRLRRAT